MKSTANRTATAPTRRRGLLLSAGAAGAAVVAAKALPIAPAEVPAGKVKPTPDEKGGYQLTQHVLRYYETTKD
jgi:hypothetical protein